MKNRTPTIRLFLFSFFLLFVFQPSIQAQSNCLNNINTAEINETTLHYIECGQGEPLLFVHGSLGDYRSWINQVEPFSENYRIISYSRRYHFPNPWPQNASDFSASIHAKDLAAFIQTLSLENVHLVGHSYGALTSLLVTLEYPELVESLTLGEAPAHSLLVTTAEGKTVFDKFMRHSISPSHFAFRKGNIEEGVQLFINGVLGEGSYGTLPPVARIFMLENAREMKNEMKGVHAKGIDFFPSITCEDAEQVKTPTFLLDGELSPSFLRLINDALERCMPNTERAVIPDASHDLKIQEPPVFSELVLEFLDEQ